MPKKTRLKPQPAGKIEKAGDKEWNDWYNSLDAKEHEKHLAQLGLDKDDIEDWEEGEGFKEPSKETKELLAKELSEEPGLHEFPSEKTASKKKK